MNECSKFYLTPTLGKSAENFVSVLHSKVHLFVIVKFYAMNYNEWDYNFMGYSQLEFDELN